MEKWKKKQQEEERVLFFLNGAVPSSSVATLAVSAFGYSKFVKMLDNDWQHLSRFRLFWYRFYKKNRREKFGPRGRPPAPARAGGCAARARGRRP